MNDPNLYGYPQGEAPESPQPRGPGMVSKDKEVIFVDLLRCQQMLLTLVWCCRPATSSLLMN